MDRQQTIPCHTWQKIEVTDDIPVIVEWLKQMEIAKCIDQKLKEA